MPLRLILLLSPSRPQVPALEFARLSDDLEISQLLARRGIQERECSGFAHPGAGDFLAAIAGIGEFLRASHDLDMGDARIGNGPGHGANLAIALVAASVVLDVDAKFDVGVGGGHLWH